MRDLLQVLKAELEFLEGGCYREDRTDLVAPAIYFRRFAELSVYFRLHFHAGVPALPVL